MALPSSRYIALIGLFGSIAKMPVWSPKWLAPPMVMAYERSKPRAAGLRGSVLPRCHLPAITVR